MRRFTAAGGVPRTRSDTHDDVTTLSLKIAVIETKLDGLPKKNRDALPVIGLLIAIVFPIAGIIYAAGELPGKDDYATLSANSSTRDDVLESEVARLRESLAELRSTLKSLQKELDRAEAILATKVDRRPKR